MSKTTKERPVAIVTGGSRGIGRGIALALAQQGYAVAVNYRSQQAAADEVVRQIQADGGVAASFCGDVADLENHASLLDAVTDTWRRLDVLVNNAGITSPGRKDVLEATRESWDLVMNTNLRGPFFLSQQFAQRLTAKPNSRSHARSIVNISSISAYAVSTNRPDYCIAKAALRMMTQLFAVRLADEGIGVYEVCPGVIASDMTAPVKEKYDRLISDGLTPIRRWGTPEDVGRAVSLLASGALSFSTGDCLNVDGGFHIRRL